MCCQNMKKSFKKGSLLYDTSAEYAGTSTVHGVHYVFEEVMNLTFKSFLSECNLYCLDSSNFG